MLHEMNSFDEYQYFRSLLKALQSNNPQGFISLVHALKKDDVDKLTEVIKSQRVHLGGFTQTTEVRKIVKPKVIN